MSSIHGTINEFIAAELFGKQFAADVCFHLSHPAASLLSSPESCNGSTPAFNKKELPATVIPTNTSSERECRELEIIYAHKLILARSPVFRTMFYEVGMAESINASSTSSITSPNLSPFIYSYGNSSITVIKETATKKAFMEFLKFMYMDQCDLSGEIVFEIFQLAHKYQIYKLEEKCSAYMSDCIALDNVFMLYSQARLYNQKGLLQRCHFFLQKNARTLLNDYWQDFAELKSSDILLILQDDKLRVDECTMFEACLKWAQSECDRKGLEQTSEHYRKVMKKILPFIRFPTMHNETFATRVLQTGILPQDDAMSILVYWVSNSKIPVTKFNTKPRKDKRRDFLIIGASVFEHNEDVQKHIQAAAVLSQAECKVEAIDARRATPTLEQIQEYDAVLVYSNFSFLDPVALGDTLAAYVDMHMGGVVICAFANCKGNLSVKGKFTQEDYMPVTLEEKHKQNASSTSLITSLDGSPIAQQSNQSIMVPVDLTHPIMEGVKLFDGGKYRSKCAIQRDVGRLIAKWPDDTPMIVENLTKKVVALNFFGTSSNCSSESWKSSTDGGKILLNSLMFVSE